MRNAFGKTPLAVMLIFWLPLLSAQTPIRSAHGTELGRQQSVGRDTTNLSLQSGEPLLPAALPAESPGIASVHPRALLIIADSVVLGAQPAIRREFIDWRIEFVARPALTLKAATEELRRRQAAVAPVVIVAVGYNSLWERNRKNFAHWSQRFDREAQALVDVLRARGAEHFVWVLLRELTLELVPRQNASEFSRSWYFPYVNERLRLLAETQRGLTLADWATAGRRTGITYDFIHLNESGARLMVEVLKSAMGLGGRKP